MALAVSGGPTQDCPVAMGTALVTGASRGIGRATAVALARAGLDVAVTARTRREGEGVDSSDTGEGRALPGSLETTAREVEALGRRALVVVADLHDHQSLTRCVESVHDALGEIDVLVNNAVDTGPGSMVPFIDLGIDQLQRKLSANVVSQAVLIKATLPSMLAAGAGVIDLHILLHHRRRRADLAADERTAPGRGQQGMHRVLDAVALGEVARPDGFG